MNVATPSLPLTGFAPDPRQLKRVGAGIAISIALHALLLSIQRPSQTAPAAAPPDRLTVRLRPVEPAAPPVPVPAPRPMPRQQEAVKPTPAKRARPARPVISVAPETRASEEEDSFKVAPAPASPVPDDAAPSSEPAPKFDLNAARATARAQANVPDPAKAGTALERLPPKPLETESRLSRAIGAAKRGNCKDGIPGGLFAPLYLMMDKKDHGCKW